jgi:hypothetical protein
MTKSSKMKWLQHVEHNGEIRNVYNHLLKTLKEIVHLGDLGICERIMLKWISEKYGVNERTGSSWPWIGSRQRGNEYFGSINGQELH